MNGAGNNLNAGEMSDAEGSLDNLSLSSVQPILSNKAQDGDKGEDGENGVEKKDPEVSGDEEIEELDPVLDRYFKACQKGDLKTVKEMIEGNVIRINEDFDQVEKVTGLHWASINNRLSIVAYLVANGANVNAKAGALHAPPIHWAARYGYVYIVHYLLEHGADAILTDDQGFNLLHLSVNSSNIMLVQYVLFFVVSKGLIDVDCQDPNGRTPLLWAAYQGDSLTVESLLRFGAHPKVPDSGGFTPLHWGTLKGQPHVLMYLIQAGADFFIKTNDGKDCFTIAKDMNTVYSLNEALSHCGFDAHGYPYKKYFAKSYHAKLVTFFIPWVFLGIAFGLFAHIHPLIALPITLAFGIATLKALNQFVLTSYENNGVTPLSLLRTPLCAGVFSGSVFWLIFVWIRFILPVTLVEEFGSNLALFLLILGVGYHFVKLLRGDPGRIPSETDLEEIRKTVGDLLKTGKYDTRHFCIESWIRKPLRSRFSSLNDTQVARFDHYCPWIYNDVGLKSHKRFVYFVVLIELAIGFFAYLCLEYFDELEDNYDDYNGELKCFLLGDSDLCAGFSYDLFTSLILLWAVFQSIWVGCLMFVQAFQIYKGVTSYEYSKAMRDSKRINLDPVLVNEFFSTAPEDLDAESTSESRGTANETNNTDGQRGPMPPLNQSRRCFGTFCAITGMDQWIMVLKEAAGISREALGSSRSSPQLFPTDYGWKTNIKDFWLLSDKTAPVWQRIAYMPTSSKALLGGQEVDYYKLYAYPEKIESRS